MTRVSTEILPCAGESKPLILAFGLERLSAHKN